MKRKSYVPALAATALIGLSSFALSSTAFAAGNSTSGGSMPNSDSTMSHGSMSKSGDTMSHNSMSGAMSKSKVKEIQMALKKKGMDVKTDGIMGPDTMSALRKYQKKNDLKVTGHPDKATCKSLGVSMGGNSMMKKNSTDKKWHHGDSSTNNS